MRKLARGHGHRGRHFRRADRQRFQRAAGGRGGGPATPGGPMAAAARAAGRPPGSAPSTPTTGLGYAVARAGLGIPLRAGRVLRAVRRLPGHPGRRPPRTGSAWTAWAVRASSRSAWRSAAPGRNHDITPGTKCTQKRPGGFPGASRKCHPGQCALSAVPPEIPAAAARHIQRAALWPGAALRGQRLHPVVGRGDQRGAGQRGREDPAAGRLPGSRLHRGGRRHRTAPRRAAQPWWHTYRIVGVGQTSHRVSQQPSSLYQGRAFSTYWLRRR